MENRNMKIGIFPDRDLHVEIQSEWILLLIDIFGVFMKKAFVHNPKE